MGDHAEDISNYDLDVTIYLIPNSTTEKDSDRTSPTRKRKRMEGMEGAEAELQGLMPSGEIHANSIRLRHCSKYFDSCMSGRWTQAEETSSPTKFYLEVQTEKRYYHDCFSRMKLLRQPIEGVRHCIELLKVASQIEYKELIDICLRCLSAISWSPIEEEQIRHFCRSGQYFSLDSATDLSARLQLHLVTERDKQEELGTCVQRSLSRYLECAFEPYYDSRTHPYRREESREVLEKAFQTILVGNTCECVLQCALTSVKKESERLLSAAIEGHTGEEPSKPQESLDELEEVVSNIWWLFQTLRKANAAHAVVEVLLERNDFAQHLRVHSTMYANPWVHRENHIAIFRAWQGVQTDLTKMITVIFEDILDGRLFLTTSERVTLFQQWDWILRDPPSIADEPRPSYANVITRFIMSLPLRQQEEINRQWMRRDYLDTYEPENFCDLSQAHTAWMMSLITHVPSTKQKHMSTASVEGNERGSPAGMSRSFWYKWGASSVVATEGGSACPMIQTEDPENLEAGREF